MRLTAQADLYIEKYGPEDGIRVLKTLGYQSLIYQLTPQCLTRFSDDDFVMIGEEIKKSGMLLPFNIYARELYLDHVTHEFEERKETCIKAVKATALMGGKVLVVRPLTFRNSTPQVWEESKRLTYELYAQVKEEADKLGVKLAFFNNTKQLCFSSGTYSYGCRGSELLELAETFESGVVIDPVYALKSGERVEELLLEVREKLLGFCVTDMAQREITSALPMFGGVDYYGLIHFFKNYQSDAAVVMMNTPILNRYTDFLENKNLIMSISKAFYKMGCLISGNKTENEDKE